MTTKIELDACECMVLSEELPILVQVAEENGQSMTAAILRDILGKVMRACTELEKKSA